MRSRLSVVTGALLAATVLSGAEIAAAWEPSRLDMTSVSVRQQIRGSINRFFHVSSSGKAGLAARQDLQDEICIAKADGRITPEEYSQVLADAKQILTPEEIPSFQKHLNQLAFPTSGTLQHPMVVERSDMEMLEKADAQVAEHADVEPAEVTEAVETVVEDTAFETETVPEKHDPSLPADEGDVEGPALGQEGPALGKVAQGTFPVMGALRTRVQSLAKATARPGAASSSEVAEPDRMASLAQTR